MNLSKGLLRKMLNKKLVRDMGTYLFIRKLDRLANGK